MTVKLAIVFGMLMVLVAGVTYVDQSAVARVEAKNWRTAHKAEQQSRKTVETLSAKESREHDAKMATARKRISALEASAARKNARAAPAPKGDPFCRPGCRIRK